MDLLSLGEHRTTYAVPLSREQTDSLRRLIPSLGISPTSGQDGCYDLMPGSVIGTLSLPDLALEIRPKIAIGQVLFLLSYALDPRAWRAQRFDFPTCDSLFEAVVEAFLLQLRQAFRRGLLQGYRVMEEALPGLRGRIRIDDHLRRRFGLAPPIEVSFDEYTEDIEPNRLLRAAIDRLGRLRLWGEESRISLRRAGKALERVSLREYSPALLPEIVWDRLNEHYRGAVELAKLILRGTAFDLGHGTVRASAFLVDMNQVFEAFLVKALREALGLDAGTFPRGAAGRALWLDRSKAIQLKPDLSWWEASDCVFVGDVKYKRIATAGASDIYQLLAYTIASGLPRGTLIYAAGEDPPEIHEVVELGKHLEIRTLDLGGTPDDILRQVESLAGRIREMRLQGTTARKSS